MFLCLICGFIWRTFKINTTSCIVMATFWAYLLKDFQNKIFHFG